MVPELRKNRLQSGWIFCGSAFLGDEDFQQMRRTTSHTNDCLLQNLQRKINFLNISFGGVGWTLSLSVYMLQKESSIQILSISKVQDNGEPTNVKMYISYIQTGDFFGHVSLLKGNFFGDGHGRNPRWGSSFWCLTRKCPWRSSQWDTHEKAGRWVPSYTWSYNL